MTLDYEDKLEVILDWAENSDLAREKRFDSSTFEEIQKYYERNGRFTSGQENAIDNVYNKWRLKYWKN